MANPYYNTGTNHSDYQQMPQSPFQQSTTPTTQHLYQHSPYAVHPLSQHAHTGYATADGHSVLYTPTTLHHSGRWDDTDPDYEMDQQTHDHHQQLQQLQAPSAQQDSQPHQNLQPHPPMPSISNQPEQTSPVVRPGVIRTGRRGRPPGSKNKVPARRKSSPESKVDEPDSELLDESGRGIKTKYGRKVHAPQQFQPTQSTSRKRRPVDDTHYCHICTRSGSPHSNKLVFCDHCDTPYHQHCHQPPVSDQTIASSNKWYCSSCKHPPLVDGLNSRMPGQGMSEGQKRSILQNLSMNHLIDLLLYASSIQPSLDLFPTGETVDQFQVPRLQSTPRLIQQMPEMDMNDHGQYSNARIPEPPEPQQPLPMTPQLQDTVPQQSPIESPIYGQTVDLPHYELMIVNALNAINDPNGSPPKAIWDWMNSNYPCNPKFRASASQALQKALKKGRLLKTGSLYKINPDFNPINAENPKATRKPQVGRLHPLFNQMTHSRNNSIASMPNEMSTPQQLQHQQQQQLQPSADLPPLTMAAQLPGLNLTSRDHEDTGTYLDHTTVFSATMDPTHGYDPPRPPSSHDQHVIPPFTHHNPHQM